MSRALLGLRPAREALRLAARPSSTLRPLLARSVSSNPGVAGEYGPWDVRLKDRGINPEYPHVQQVNAQHKSQTVQYEDFQDRRNLNDKVHEDDEILTVWAIDDATFTDTWTALRQLLMMGGFLFLFYQAAKAYNAPSRKPIADKEYIEGRTQV